MGSYVPSTDKERSEMLEAVGLKSLECLFDGLPKEMIVGDLNLPDGMAELQVLRKMQEISGKNKIFGSIFRGAGAYNHYIPAIVKSVTSKEEFVTAYTPYQPEISQGILQAIFEYQTVVCEITGMDASNASIYDGASAAAEAVAMCVDRKRKKAVISASANPDVLETVKTYCWASGTELQIAPESGGVTDIEALEKMLDAGTACVYLQQPNYYGCVEDAEKIAEIAHAAGAKLIMGINPIAAVALKSPAECGADIAVGEGQPLGMPLSFGGPYLGFMAAKTALVRSLPGRIVGQTTDVNGKRAFVLTLQAREQHIRREKASSNVCSNQALCALTAAAYAAALGADGMREVAIQSASKAHYLADKLSEIQGFKLRYDREFFNEFVTDCDFETAGDSMSELLTYLAEHGILGGLEVDGGILWCATEVNTKEEIDRLAELCVEFGKREVRK